MTASSLCADGTEVVLVAVNSKLRISLMRTENSDIRTAIPTAFQRPSLTAAFLRTNTAMR